MGRRTGRRRAGGSWLAGPARPVADERDLVGQPDPVPPIDLGPDTVAQAADIVGRALAVVDDEVGVLLAHARAALALALEPGLIDQGTRRWPRVRVPEHAP